MSTCPACFREQGAGLLCSACTATLEYELSEVPAIVGELETTLSKQGRIGAGGHGGLASEKTPIHTGAMDPVWVLGNVLTTWARDITGDDPQWPTSPGRDPAITAAHILLSEVNTIRKHPAADEIMDEVCDAIRLARRTVDRPADRQFLGPCNGMFEGVRCTADVYASPGASHARCKVCGSTIDVAEQRAWLLEDSEDRLFTVREAAQMMGAVGRIQVTESSIRGYIFRGKIGYHTGKLIRLGDLLAVIVNEGERRSA